MASLAAERNGLAEMISMITSNGGKEEEAKGKGSREAARSAVVNSSAMIVSCASPPIRSYKVGLACATAIAHMNTTSYTACRNQSPGRMRFMSASRKLWSVIIV